MAVRVRLPSISYIVARSWPGNVIGCDNELPWHLRTDLQRFKKITHGHAVIMGRKTLESIGKPLPGRINIVLSRTSEPDQRNDFWQTTDTMLLWAGTRIDALFFADILSIARNKRDLFVIGGADMFDIFSDLFNKIYITEVFMDKPCNGDVRTFEYKFDGRQWSTLDEQDVPAGPYDQYPTRFSIYERRTKQVRYVNLNQYMTEKEAKKAWISDNIDQINSISRKSKSSYQFEIFEESSSMVG